MDKGFLEAALKMSMALGAVLMVFAACVFAFKKFSNYSHWLGKKTKKLGRRPIEIISHQSLGPGKTLYLVQCEGRKILLGATNSQIQSVATFDGALDSFESEFESSLSEQSEGSAGQFKADMGRGLKDISRV